MKTENYGPVGCVLIDDYLSGTSRLSGLSSFLESREVSLYAPDWQAAGDLLSALQTALQAARAAVGGVSAIAWGTGCWAALALAEQLPVERLVLIDPKTVRRDAGSRADGVLFRQMVRLERFAERNLPLCVSDMLVIRPRQPAVARSKPLLCGGNRPHGRLLAVETGDFDAHKLLEIDDIKLKNGIYSFLSGGDFPKSLAEKSEMCIIDG